MKNFFGMLVVVSLGLSSIAYAGEGESRFQNIKNNLNKTTSVTSVSGTGNVSSGGWKSAVDDANNRWTFDDSALRAKDASLQSQINSLKSKDSSLSSRDNSLQSQINTLKSASSGGSGRWVYTGNRGTGVGMYMLSGNMAGVVCAPKGAVGGYSGTSCDERFGCSTTSSFYRCQ